MNVLMTDQAEVDKQNAEFWDYICGTNAARSLGLTGHDRETLKAFDDWYLGYYPYLLQRVPVHTFAGKRVLEVGLGYGALSQKIVEAGADYLGLDIAAAPVGIVRERLRLANLSASAQQSNFLANGLESGSFDVVVSVGCFHHTGDLQGCLDQSWRLLSEGGWLYCMVHNRYSHRHWMKQRSSFIRNLLLEGLGLLRLENASESERGASDRNGDGDAAPLTVYLSKGELRRRLGRFSQVRIVKENMDDSMDPKWRRERVLNTWGPRMGLDLYVQAKK